MLVRTAVLKIDKVNKGLMSRWRNIYFRLLGVNLHGYVWMQKIEIPQNFEEIEVESSCALDRGVVLLCSGKPQSHPKIYIGANTYVNRQTFLDASLSLIIGRNCAIGPNCYITDHDHGGDSDLAPLEQPLISKPTRLEDQVWLGANVTVLKGVTIGSKTVVGAGSVVNRDLPSNVVAVGVPAKVIRSRGKQTTHI